MADTNITAPTKKLLLSIFVLILSGCGLGQSRVEIQNQSGYPVSNLNVLIGGNSLKVDRIESGENATITYKPRQDSSLNIIYQSEQDSKSRSCAGDVYITTGIRDDFIVVLNADGGCTVLLKTP